MHMRNGGSLYLDCVLLKLSLLPSMISNVSFASCKILLGHLSHPGDLMQLKFRPLNQAIRYYIDSHIIAIIQSSCPNYIYIDKGLYKTVNYSSGHFVVHSREIGVQ